MMRCCLDVLSRYDAQVAVVVWLVYLGRRAPLPPLVVSFNVSFALLIMINTFVYIFTLLASFYFTFLLQPYF